MDPSSARDPRREPGRLDLQVRGLQRRLPGLASPVYVDLSTGESAYAVPESPETAIVGDGPNDMLERPEEAVPLPQTPYEVLETLSIAVPAAVESYPRSS